MHHNDIIEAIEAHKERMPEGVFLGYDVRATHRADGTPIPPGERIRADQEIKRQARREVGLRGKHARKEDVPADASDTDSCHVLIEVMDTRVPGPPWPTVYRAVPFTAFASMTSKAKRKDGLGAEIDAALAELAKRAGR